MTPKKDNYMRGYHDGFKEAAPEMLEVIKATFLALCDAPADRLTDKCFESIDALSRVIAKAEAN